MNNPYLEYMLYESETNPIGIPSGVPFLAGDELKTMENKAAAIEKIFHKKSFLKVVPPAFEYYETFEKGGGLDIARRSFSFKDKDGKLLSLRYDMTTPIARMAAMKYKESDAPLKFYYSGDVYREQPLHKGRLRQIKQVGVELIGDSTVQADISTISLLAESLSELDINYKIVLGDVKLYQFALSKLRLDNSQTQSVHSMVNRKDTASLSIILGRVEGKTTDKELLMALPSLSGSLDQVKEKVLTFGKEAGEATQRYFEVLEKLPGNIKSHLIADLGLIKDFSYYTSLTMEGYISNSGNPVASGGRYDELFKEFGKDHPAIGFAVDLSYCL